MATRNPYPPASTPFVDGRGFLTVSALQFLQPLFNLASGLGGSGPDALLSIAAAAGGFSSVDPGYSVWTPTVQGSTTAGAQTYGTQAGWQVDIGPLRLAMFQIVLTALDGATAGNVQIGGMLCPAGGVAPIQAGWLSDWRATLTASYTQLGAHVAAAASVVDLMQAGSGQAPLALPVAGIGATAAFTGGAVYFR